MLRLASDSDSQETFRRRPVRLSLWRATMFVADLVTVVALATLPVGAQASPWENAVTVLETSFTGPIARGLSLVAIVVGGLMMAFGDQGGKRAIAGIVFGIGMAISAVSFLGWLFV